MYLSALYHLPKTQFQYKVTYLRYSVEPTIVITLYIGTNNSASRRRIYILSYIVNISKKRSITTIYLNWVIALRTKTYRPSVTIIFEYETSTNRIEINTFKHDFHIDLNPER